MTARRGPSVSVINSIRGADECQHHSMVLMEPWGLCLTLTSDTLWLPWPGLRDRVTKTSTPISHSSALQCDCCLALLRKEKNTAKLCGFRKPGSCLRGHQTQPCHSLIIISLRFADWARMCGVFFAKDGCRTKGSLMTLANLRWSYLWHKCSRKSRLPARELIWQINRGPTEILAMSLYVNLRSLLNKHTLEQI